MRKLFLYASILLSCMFCAPDILAGKVLSRNIISPDSVAIESAYIPLRFALLKAKDIEKFTGKKLTFKEKLALKICKSKLNNVKRKAEKGQYSKRSKTAFILSILSLVTIIFFPVSAVLAIISIVLASKSLKENNEDKKARTAMNLSILALGLIVVGLLIYGIFVSDDEFGIFVL